MVIASSFLDDNVGLARGRLVGSRSSTTILSSLLAAKTTASTEEDSHLVVKHILAGGGINSGDGVLCDGGVALVDDLKKAAARDELGVCGDGELADLEVLLAVEEHHGGEVGDDGVVVEGHLGVEGGDDAKGGDDLEVVGAFKDVLEVGALGSDAEVVEDGISLLIVKLGRVALLLESLVDGLEVLTLVGTRLYILSAR